MSKILLVGPARSGKTHAVLDEFEKTWRAAKDPLAEDYFLLLPSIEHAERIISLLMQRDVHGFFHRRVTTLSRLISELFALGDENVAGNVTRYLILRDLFASQAWPCFEKVQHGAGFLNLMLAFLSELKESLVDAAHFRERMNQMKRLEPDLAPKYEALASIFEMYESRLAAAGLRDRADAIRLYREKKAAGKLPQTRLTVSRAGTALGYEKQVLPQRRFKRIWLDGFFDFTPLQLGYLKELATFTDELTITLTFDATPGRETLFESARETAGILERMGFEKRALKQAAAPSAPVLQHLERQLFLPEKRKPMAAAGAAVQIFAAIGMEGEIEMIARAILKQHRAAEVRYSDFALLFRQIGPYEAVIRSVFSRYGIPVEIHERERLHYAPLIQAIAGLLRIFVDGWKRADLITFLKSSYVRSLGAQTKDPDGVAQLEHAAMTRGIFRNREVWLRPWSEGSRQKPAGKLLDERKEVMLRPLAQLEDGLRAAKSYAAFRKLLEQAVEKTFRLFEPETSVRESVRRDAASFSRFLGLLDEIERSFARADTAGLTIEAFAERFFRLTELDLYSLHEKDKNKVQVYDVSLARQKEYRFVFVCGLLEKRFPIQIKEDPVLSDWERRLFNEQEKEEVLKPRLPRQSVERYLFYLAVTRASQKLFLTYPRIDLEGQVALPSYYVQEVARLFETIETKKQELGRPFPDLDEAVNERELEMALLGAWWRPEAESEQHRLLLTLTNGLLAKPQNRSRFQRAFYQMEEGLQDPRILELAPFQFTATSATKLEEYGKCPFRYYSRFVLKLQDPEEDQNVMTRGTILHDVLEKCFMHWKQHPSYYENLERAGDYAFQLLDAALEEHPLFLEKPYQKDLEREEMRDMLRWFLTTEMKRLSQSPLRPQYFEYDFGLKQPATALEIHDQERVIRIRGKIDRIDVDPEGKVGRVMDYKRTAQFKADDMDLGTALQLSIYARVLQRRLGLKVAAAELYSIKEGKLGGFYQKDFLHLIPDAARKKAIYSEQAFENILERSEWFIRRYARAMSELAIPVRPRLCSPKYAPCAYACVCRIEKWRRPMILDEIRKEDRELWDAEKGAPAL